MEIQSREIIMDFRLEYFNTSSAKTFFEIFKRLSYLNKNGHKVTVNWYAEENDEDLIETGEDFEELTSLNFNYLFY